MKTVRVPTSICVVVVVACMVGALLPVATAADPGLPINRPNILLLISDDQAWSTFNRDLMPNVFSQLVDKGVLFSRAYVNESQCCPSRSQILTGLYGQHTGVDGNDVQLDRPTIVQALHDVGYRTMLSGKYLNSWPCDPRPEFDQWACSASGPSNYSLVDPKINVNGTWKQFSGYTTDIEANFVTDFIASTPASQPFFVMYTPTSPHLPANDPRCAGIPVQPYRPPSFDEETRNDGKPSYMQRRPLSRPEITFIDHNHEVMTQATVCLDGSMNTVLASLGTREQDTLVIYLSDNGFLYGEHRRTDKQVPYEESVRVPFIVRYPALVPEDQPFTSDALIENVDIAATLADLVGIHWGADGLSLVPLLTKHAAAIRQTALIEFCEAVSYPCGVEGRDVPAFYGEVTGANVYVEYWTGEKELYDLVADPYELVNLAGNPDYARLQAKMAAGLAVLEAPPPTDTTIVTGPSGVVQTESVTFVYFSQSRLASYECRLDVGQQKGVWAPCGSQTQTYTGLANGPYVFNVRGTDEFGVGDPSPAKRSFSIDVGPSKAST